MGGGTAAPRAAGVERGSFDLAISSWTELLRGQLGDAESRCFKAGTGTASRKQVSPMPECRSACREAKGLSLASDSGRSARRRRRRRSRWIDTDQRKSDVPKSRVVIRGCEQKRGRDRGDVYPAATFMFRGLPDHEKTVDSQPLQYTLYPRIILQQRAVLH